MFKIVVADPKTRRTYQKEVEKAASGLIGKKIGDVVKGDVLGLAGYELQITGGSDKEGFPMRPDIPGTARKRVLLTGGPGFHPKKKGERRRKSVRGNTISEEIVQVNMKVVKYGNVSLTKLFGKEEPQEEKPSKKQETETSEEKTKTVEETEKEDVEKQKTDEKKSEVKTKEEGNTEKPEDSKDEQK